MRNIFKIKLFIAMGLGLITTSLTAGNPSEYTVATWHRFKPAAVTYTFDGYSSTSKQLSVAVPLFDQYDFKVTITAITNWIGNWNDLQKASLNGHEISSLTVTHDQLDTKSIADQEYELLESQRVINSKITNARCITLAYPYCVPGNLATVKKYYIAGRKCNGTVEPKTPVDLYGISSIITGETGSVKTGANMNTRVEQARTSKGWCVFLIHGIDNDGGYSSIASTEIASHLGYMDENKGDYWVATFADAVRYIRERNGVSITETALSPDSVIVSLTDQLPDSIYNIPLSIKRKIPAGWKNARVYDSGVMVESTVTSENGDRFVAFEAIPDSSEITIAFFESTTGIDEKVDISNIQILPNPFTEKIKLKTPGNFRYHIFSIDGKQMESGKGKDEMNAGASLPAGTYLIQVTKNSKETDQFKIVKTNQ